MSTRGMVLRELNCNSYECYYRHHDTYPTGLGAELIKALRCYSWEDIVRVCELENVHATISKPEDAFLKVQGDIEYIYEVSEYEERKDAYLTIYKTSSPYYNIPEFIFRIWGSYQRYFPAPRDVVARMAEVELIGGIILGAIAEYHKATKERNSRQ